MKKFLALAVAAVALSGSAFAQDNATAVATATVNYDVEITKMSDINFGTDLARNSDPSIAPTSGNAATFYVQGDSKDLVFFTIPNTVTLSLVNQGQLAGVVGDGTQATTMDWTTAATIRHYNAPGSSIAIVPNPHELSTAGVNDNGNHPMNSGIGQMYVYVGGSLDVAANQQRGNYSGELTVAVDYSN